MVWLSIAVGLSIPLSAIGYIVWVKRSKTRDPYPMMFVVIGWIIIANIFLQAIAHSTGST